jgi:hypothetical protein
MRWGMLRVMKMKLVVTAVAGVLMLFQATAALADTSITTSNESDDTELDSGDASATNSGQAQVGHEGGGEEATQTDISNTDATNVQEGDNDFDATQRATATTGDTIGGQVIGGVVDGNLTVDATNLSNDVDATSGDAEAVNDVDAFVGLSAADAFLADINNTLGVNVHEGDNSATADQDAVALSGDGVAGQIFGATVSGTTDAVLANTSTDNDVTSGDADENSNDDLFTGLFAAKSALKRLR